MVLRKLFSPEHPSQISDSVISSSRQHLEWCSEPALGGSSPNHGHRATHLFQINEFLWTRLRLDRIRSIHLARSITRRRRLITNTHTGPRMNSFFKNSPLKASQKIIMGNILVESSLLGFAFVPVHCFTSPRPNLVLNQNYFVDSECHLKFVFNHAIMRFFFPLSVSVQYHTMLALMDALGDFWNISRHKWKLKRFRDKNFLIVLLQHCPRWVSIENGRIREMMNEVRQPTVIMLRRSTKRNKQKMRSWVLRPATLLPWLDYVCFPLHVKFDIPAKHKNWS